MCVQLSDGRVEFTKWWLTELKAVKFPTAGTIFDYYIDPESKKFEPWTRKVLKFEYDADQPLQVDPLLSIHVYSLQVYFSHDDVLR